MFTDVLEDVSFKVINIKFGRSFSMVFGKQLVPVNVCGPVKNVRGKTLQKLPLFIVIFSVYYIYNNKKY